MTSRVTETLCYLLAYCLLCKTKSSSCSSWTWKHYIKKQTFYKKDAI